MATLRKFQRAFSAAEKSAPGKSELDRLPEDLREAAGVLAQKMTGRYEFVDVTANEHGELVSQCPCDDCRADIEPTEGAKSLVDRLVRKYGPNADAISAVRSYFGIKDEDEEDKDDDESLQNGDNEASSPQPNQSPSPAQGQNGQPQQTQPAANQPASGAGGSPSNSAAANNSAATPGNNPPADADSGAEQESTWQPPKTTKPPPPVLTPEQAALEKAREILKQATQANANDPSVKKARHAMQQARKKASFSKKEKSGSVPSLMARRQIATATGRLKRVPPKLRNKMAGLINRLVMRGGSSGESLTPIPVTSATKLVRRMVVRRPLPNALKEDTITGRPTILFLPDISPSCEEQAQIACDLANAAGYAGTSGSDVLVFPHSNGCVERSAEYIPWLNGKPMMSTTEKIPMIFRDITRGKSQFLIKVIICLGDHDAEELYRDLCTQIPRLHGLVWLHNVGAIPKPIKNGRLFPKWRAEAADKLCMIAGCSNRPTMLKGLQIAIEDF